MAQVNVQERADVIDPLLCREVSTDAAIGHPQPHSSRLERAETSWTRLLHSLCWLWMTSILHLAYRGDLDVNNLDDAPHIDQAEVVLDRWHHYDWSSTTTWSLVKREFWKDYTVASLTLIPYLILRVVQIFLFRQILLNIMHNQGSNALSYVFIVSLFVSIIVDMLMHRQSLFRCCRVGVRVRNALTMAIFTQALSLKSAALGNMNTGYIVNLVANDVCRFEEMCRYLGFLFIVSLEAIIILGFLCWIIHPIPALCGYALSPIFILIQLYFKRKFSECRERTAACNDTRVQAFSELIDGSHVVKMYNWEKAIGNSIGELRKSEAASIRRTSYFRALNLNQFFVSTSLFTLVTFGSAWLLYYPFNITNTFLALSLFSLVRIDVLYYLPLAIEKFSEAKAASKRIDSLMHLIVKPENQSLSSTPPGYKQQKGTIIIPNACFSWCDDKPCLSLSDITIEKGIFVGVTGPVGSGKSSLLSAILGEMKLTSGQININDSSLSYAAQSPWIFADTFRNNILLNRPYDEQRYTDIIHACCLDVDLRLFGSRDGGSSIMIGEKGINLSGGQKARISLARALYADVDIYLLDDPLSAVDKTVARQIYERCIGPCGLLKEKTRLLVTHQTQFFNKSDKIIFLSQGHNAEQDSLDEIIIKENYVNNKETSDLAGILDVRGPICDPQSIILDETSCNEGSRWSIWYHLFTAPPSGRFGFCLLIFLLLLGEALNDGTSYWLILCLKQSKADGQISLKFALIYLALVIATVIADIVRTQYYFTVALHGSNHMHNNMLQGLLHTSIEFFETNPSGRILNRATKDQHILDELVPVTFLEGIEGILLTIGSVIIICLINAPLFFVLIVIIPIVWPIFHYYRRSSLQIKQLENITRSPVLALLSSSLDGLPTIRCFKAEKDFVSLLSNKIDANTSAYLNVQAASQLFSVLFNAIWALMLSVICIQIIYSNNKKDSAAAALSITCAIYASSWFQWGIRQLFEADMMMTSGERINEYSRLPPEDDSDNKDDDGTASPESPTNGTIEFKNYYLKHRPQSNYIIKNINLYIESGQKIGIIGRTGIST